MTKLRAVVLLAVVALLLFPAAVFAQATPPELPCRFYGTVGADGQSVADGTVITAIIAGTEYATTTPAAGYGTSTYQVIIEQPEGMDYQGATVTFKIGPASADQTSTWIMGANNNVDLSSGLPVQECGCVRNVTCETLAAGEQCTVDWNPVTGTLKLGIPQGEQGDRGLPGIPGQDGEDGSDAGMTLSIIALVIAIIAVGIAVMGMRRKV